MNGPGSCCSPALALSAAAGTALSTSTVPYVVYPCLPDCLHDHHVPAWGHLRVSAAVSLHSPLRKVRENRAQRSTGEVAGPGEDEMVVSCKGRKR